MSYTEVDLRRAISYIRSLPRGRRWRFLPRREEYGPSVMLLSWVDHVEDLLDSSVPSLHRDELHLKILDAISNVGCIHRSDVVGAVVVDERFGKQCRECLNIARDVWRVIDK